MLLVIVLIFKQNGCSKVFLSTKVGTNIRQINITFRMTEHWKQKKNLQIILHIIV